MTGGLSGGTLDPSRAASVRRRCREGAPSTCSGGARPGSWVGDTTIAMSLCVMPGPPARREAIGAGRAGGDVDLDGGRLGLRRRLGRRPRWRPHSALRGRRRSLGGGPSPRRCGPSASRTCRARSRSWSPWPAPSPARRRRRGSGPCWRRRRGRRRRGRCGPGLRSIARLRRAIPAGAHAADPAAGTCGDDAAAPVEGARVHRGDRGAVL